jgi:hypothetical protein
MISDIIRERRSTGYANVLVVAAYEAVRYSLTIMAREGNAALKDHFRIIHDIENLFTAPSSNKGLAEEIEKAL